MKLEGSLPRLLLLSLLSVPLLSGCETVSALLRPGRAAEIPELPQEARQPSKPEICSPTCAEGWKRLGDELSSMQIAPASPAKPASASSTR